MHQLAEMTSLKCLSVSNLAKNEVEMHGTFSKEDKKKFSTYQPKIFSEFKMKKLNTGLIKMKYSNNRHITLDKAIVSRSISKRIQTNNSFNCSLTDTKTLQKNKNPGEFPFQDLPSICKLNVLSFLNEEEKIRNINVCKEWSFIKNASLWKYIDISKYCCSESKLKSFVSFLESFNCRPKSLKVCFNVINKAMSLDCLLKSEVISKLESVIIDVETASTETYTNRRQQRNFLDIFDKICTHLFFIKNFTTVFDWTSVSFENLSKFTSLNSLNLKIFPDIVCHFDQDLFDSLLKSLNCLENLSIEMRGSTVGSYENINVFSESLKTLDLSQCIGVSLNEVNLPCMKHLVLPPKLHNPMSFNNPFSHFAFSNLHKSTNNKEDFEEMLIKPKLSLSEMENHENFEDFKIISHEQKEKPKPLLKNEVSIIPFKHNKPTPESSNDEKSNDDPYINNVPETTKKQIYDNISKVSFQYKCVTKVLNEGCPSLIKINGHQVSELKINNQQNSKKTIYTNSYKHADVNKKNSKIFEDIRLKDKIDSNGILDTNTHYENDDTNMSQRFPSIRPFNGTSDFKLESYFHYFHLKKNYNKLNEELTNDKSLVLNTTMINKIFEAQPPNFSVLPNSVPKNKNDCYLKLYCLSYHEP